MKSGGWDRKALFCLIIISGFSLSVPGSAASIDCDSGYGYNPRFSRCVQSNCNGEKIPHAHLSYVGDCVCGSSESVNENPKDPNKECGRPSDYPSCPGCTYACVHLDEPCPGEKQKTTTTTSKTAVDAEPQYGVFERDGKIYINSPPNGTLKVKLRDLPPWAYGELVTIGAMVYEVGSISTLVSGDPSVTLEGIPIVRKGDRSSHGGKVEDGSDRIFINGVPAAKQGGYVSCNEWHVPLSNPEYMMPHIGGYIRGGIPPAVDDIASTPCENCDAEPVKQEPPGLTQDQFCQRLKNRMATHYIASLEYQMASDAFMEFCKDWKYGRTNVPTGRGTYKLQMSSSGFKKGDGIIIGTEKGKQEEAKVAELGSLILEEPVKNYYPAGTFVFKVPDKIPPKLQAFFKAEYGGKADGKGPYLLLAATGIIGVLAVGAAAITSLLALLLLVHRLRKKKKP